MISADTQYKELPIRELLKYHGFKSSKSMGQNFLVDPNIPEKIVKLSGIDNSCGVLEVGPGVGALTKVLCQYAGHVTAVELDKRLIPILTGMFSSKKNVSIIQGDILKTDIRKLCEETMSGIDHHVCANLPYNITTPAISAFIESGVFKSITLMLQKEVAHRICAKPGTSEYGAFTIYSNYHTVPGILFDVFPESFIPRPNVTSTVVRMNIRTDKLLDKKSEEIFFCIVRAAFNQRRKTLANALSSAFSETRTKADITEIVEKCGFDARIRGEVLGIDDFINLSRFFS